MHPIVLIHGFPLDGEMWREQARHLRGLGYQVLTPDLPGFGESRAVPALGEDEASMEAFAEYVHEIIVAQCGGKAIVGGLSMGGYVLLALLRAYPECVAAAMLMDTRADVDSPEGRAGRVKSIEDVRGRGPGAPGGLIDTMFARILGKQATDAVKQQVRRIMERQSVEAIVSTQTAMAKRRDQTDVLGQVKVPVLIVVGEEDVSTPPAVARAMRDRLAQATLAEIPGSGHMSALENPEAVNRVMEAFLSKL